MTGCPAQRSRELVTNGPDVRAGRGIVVVESDRVPARYDEKVTGGDGIQRQRSAANRVTGAWLALLIRIVVVSAMVIVVVAWRRIRPYADVRT